MKSSARKHLDHASVPWLEESPVYFVTVCSEPRGLNQLCQPKAGLGIIQSIGHYHEKGRWFCHLAVLMPDHVHFLLNFPDAPSFARIIGEWKKWLVKSQAVSWQENFFDHRLRNDEKAQYILHNPVRAGLIQDWQEWPYFWRPEK